MSSNIVTRKILILAANAKNTSRLRLDEEVRAIDEGLHRAKHHAQFELVQKWAVRPRDIHRAMLDINPNVVKPMYLEVGTSFRFEDRQFVCCGTLR